MSTKRGSILLITLWLIAVLSALAIAIARQVSLELRVVNYRVARAQARALAQGGVRLAIAVLERDGQQHAFDSLADDWAAGLTRQAPGYPADATAPGFGVTLIDEDRYVNLNLLEVTQMTSQLAMPPLVAQAIVDDRDVRNPSEDRVRDTPPYQARNDAFTCVEQLSDVPGMTDALLVTLRKAASPWRGASENKLNLNTAPYEALVGFGFTSSGAKKIEDERKGTSVFKDVRAINAFANQTGIDPHDFSLLTGNQLTVTSSVFTIEAKGYLPRSSAEYTIHAVMTRAPQAGAAATSTTPTLLAWREG